MLASVFLAAAWLTGCAGDPETGVTPAGGTSGTSSGAAGTSSGAAGTSSGAAGTTSGAAGTTSGAAGTTSSAAGTSGGAAGTSGGAAGSSGGGTSGSAGRGGTSGAVGGRGGRGGTTGRGGGAGTSSAPDGGVSPDGSTGGSSGGAPTAYAVCTPCHGSDGTGVSGHGPDIQHPVVDFATWVIRNGRVHPDFPEQMPMFTTAQLSDAQLQSIFSFLAAFPKPTTGMGLFRDFCANCHGADAAGGVTMRPIATEPMTAFTTNVRNGHSAGMFSNRREFMPKWTAAQITDAEIRLIFTYVSGL